ncbi:MAG: helix-turn-helix domain-containing protein [Lachnospiraceae bacterium]|nr:helix-turn-helix domain-containing protein [Lachnospiraceae bacterium]
MNPEIFGEFIVQCRKELGLTQLQLGQMIHVSDKTVSRWERGIGFPEISVLPALAQALQVNISELMNCQRELSGADMQQEDVCDKTVLNTLEIAKTLVTAAKVKCMIALALALISEISGIVIACWYIENLTIRSVFVFILVSAGTCVSVTLGTLIKMK